MRFNRNLERGYGVQLCILSVVVTAFVACFFIPESLMARLSKLEEKFRRKAEPKVN